MDPELTVNKPQYLVALYKGILAKVLVGAVAVTVLHSCRSNSESELMENNQRAVATIIVYGGDGKVISQGSGFFINSTGLLITNAHVVKGMESCFAKLSTGAFYALKEIKSIDKTRDFVVLQFDAKESPSISGLGNSEEIRVGEKVYAIGTPIGQENTVSEGNISNPNQQVGGQRFIQFTAPISPGSSGGGLFNHDGFVIGVTSLSVNIAVGSQKGLAQNLNYAVPINEVKTAIDGTGKVYQGSAVFYYVQGNLADNKKDWNNAILNYSKAIELDSSYSDAYIGLGGVNFARGDYELEVENYLAATKIAPTNSTAHYLLATAYEDIGKYGEAMESFKEALSLDPNNKDIIHDFALLCLASGDKEGASLLIQKLSHLDPGWGAVLESILKHAK